MHISSVALSVLLLNASIPSSSAHKDEKKPLHIRYLKHNDPQAKKALFASHEGFKNRGKLFRYVADSRNPERALRRVVAAIRGGRSIKEANKKRLADMFRLVKLDELEAITEVKGGCSEIGPFLAFFERSMLAKLSDARCIRMMVKAAKSADPQGLFAANIPAEWIEPRLIKEIAPMLNNASTSFLKALSGTTEYAKFVRPKVLGKMKAEQVQQLSSAFLAKISRLLESPSISKVVPMMNDDAFSMYEGRVSIANAKAMRGAQVQKLNSKNPDRRCYRFPIGYLTDDIFREAVDGKCILSYLSNKRVPAIGRKWALVKDSIVNGASDEALSFVRNIRDKDKEHISSATWNALLRKQIVCESIRGEGVFSSSQQIEASSQCFAELRDGRLMAKILLNPNVSEDILAHANKRTMERIVHVAGGTEYKGFHILSHMKADSARKAAILSHISTKSFGGHHACAAIDSIEIIHKNRNEFEAAPVDCFTALRVDISDADREQSPCLLAAMDLTEAMEAYTGKWPSISKNTLAALLKRGIAHEISKETLLLVNKDALPAFVGLYVKELSFLSEIPKDLLNRFADDAFAYFDAEKFSKTGLDYDKITNKQLPHVSTRVADATKRAMVHLTSTTVKSLASRFAKFTSLQMEAVPPEAWAGVSEGVFPDIAPEALTRVTLPQMARVEEKVRLTLTAKQAELVGRDTEEKASPLAAFVTLMEKLDKDTQAILKKRMAVKAAATKPKNAASSTSFSSVNAVAIVALAALAFLF